MSASVSCAAPEVTRIDLMQVRVPLPGPVTLGPTRITQRDYVCLRMVFADGSEGHATGFERGMPLFDIALRMAPLALGQSAALRGAVRKAGLGPAPAGRPVHMRGISLVNIALWDGFCRQIGQPLWAVLGGVRRRVPLMPVIGYGATPELIGRQCTDLAARGFSVIKIMIDGTDAAVDAGLMRAAAAALPKGVRFGIDAHWSWRTVAEAMATCAIAEETGAAFIEDPFTPSQWRTVAELQALTRVPIAVGEDVIDRHGFRDLAEAGRILRPDASASGGIDGFLEALALANGLDRSVIPHVFPALHAQFGYASEVIERVEMILPEVGADPIDRFMAEAPTIAGGALVASDTPGAATALDWDRLQPFVTRAESLS